MDFLNNIWSWICSFTTKYIAEPFSMIGIKDILDILLLSFLIYSLYKFFRKRRAGKMLAGLVVIVVASLLVDLIGFPALSYLVKIFSAAAFFCVIVIFQPEFRDTLEHIGNLSFLNLGKNNLSRKHLNTAIAVTDEVVDAVMKMSTSHTGCLIVFEGLTKLGDFVQTGKHVDAALTSHMLQNIFFDKAPLHDGALIVRDMRILAAGCVLPPARSKIDFDGMGTRHRAAVGVTEVSDALVIIVSEQTGRISVAQNRKLIRGLDEESLKDILLTYIAGNTYLHAKRVAAEERFQSVIDERLQDMVNANRAKEGGDTAPSIAEEPSDEAMPKEARHGKHARHTHDESDTEDDSKT